MNLTDKISSLNNILEKKYKIIIILFFSLYLAVGASVFQDYGMSDDEPTSRFNAIVSAAYINSIFNFNKRILPNNYFPKIYRLGWPNKIPDIKTYDDRDYGVLFELVLLTVEYVLDKMMDLNNFRDIFLLRHFFTFLMFWISTIFFFLLVKNIFQDWKIGLLGCLFLILSPRIFGHSFYNSKDIIFLSFSIISIFTLIHFIQKKTYTSAAFHAIGSAALISIRIPGVYITFITILFFSIEIAKSGVSKRIIKEMMPVLLIYLLLLPCFIYIFWPYLWENPVGNFIQAWKNMSNFRWPWDVLYWGYFIKASNLPWHYIPSWLVITTPVLHTCLFLLGTLYIIIRFLRHPFQIYTNETEKSDLIFLSLFFMPLLSVIILKSVLYDGWRQMYFIYPAFLLIGLSGLVHLIRYIRLNFSGISYMVTNLILTIMIIYTTSDTAFSMIKYHPHQNVYFNCLAGDHISKKFELDYWGLSYKQALEYILNIDGSDEIIIFRPYTLSLNYNVDFLGKDAQKRIRIVDSLKEADYFLTNYRATWYRMFYDKFFKEEYPFKDEIFSVKVKNYKIVGIYKPTLYAKASFK